MSKYLAPTSDVVFKKIFGQHPHLMKSFLNAVFPEEALDPAQHWQYYFQMTHLRFADTSLVSREVKKLGILWLRFMHEINEETKKVPSEFLENPEISEAVQLSEEAAYTPNELRYYESYWDEIRRVNSLVEAGEEKTKNKIALKMLSQGLATPEIMDLTGLSKEQVQNLRP